MSRAKDHWEKVYATKELNEVSWFEDQARCSLELIDACELGLHASIIDVGAGGAALVDDLMTRGFTDVTILDLAASALEQARERLGRRSTEVTWIEGDVLTDVPLRAYHLWHDRALLHFLSPREVATYRRVLEARVRPGGFAIIGAFGPNGPDACSGLPVTRYGPDSMTEAVGPRFRPLAFREVEHRTPAGGTQSFLFGLFERRASRSKGADISHFASRRATIG